MKKILIIISATIAVSLISYLIFNTIYHTSANAYTDPEEVLTSVSSPDSVTTIPQGETANDYSYIPPVPENSSDATVIDPVDSGNAELDADPPFVVATELDIDPKSITMLVNREYSLQRDYIPENMVVPNVLFNITNYDERKLMRPEAAEALEKLFAAARADGYNLCGISAYRSYDRQYKIFIDNIVKTGKKHTLKYSAVPGTSEHQTGLAIDVSSVDLEYKLITTFASTPEGIWLADNAHHFGYIIRYPLDKTDITGYAYEPWHIRYVGEGLATYLYENDLSLDEYYHYTPGEGFDFEAIYKDLINFTPTPTPSIIPSLTPTPSLMPTPTLPLVEEEGTVTGIPEDGLDDTTPGEESDLPGVGDSEGVPSGEPVIDGDNGASDNSTEEGAPVDGSQTGEEIEPGEAPSEPTIAPSPNETDTLQDNDPSIVTDSVYPDQGMIIN